MSKYIIHACPERMWYVNNYLIPSMLEQGIDKKDIDTRCDDQMAGNLSNCMKIFESMPDDNDGAWHIQDDVIICRDFKERTENPNDEIICGYVRMNGNHSNKTGYVDLNHMWWSFPCIYIPNRYARECAYWFYNEAKLYTKYRKLMKTRKDDDMFFMEYLKLKSKSTDLTIYNMCPNLVDHIDFLIGGTIVNKDRENMNVRARYFDDTDLVDELARKIDKDKA